MKTLILQLLVVSAFSCGGIENSKPDASVEFVVDEANCLRETLEQDGRDSAQLMMLPVGNYVVSSTYLRLKLNKETLALFSKLNDPMTETLKANTGLIQVVTRLSEACNSARTLSVWKDEASMFAFVASDSHAAAVAQVRSISRGGSVVTHWNTDNTGYNWDRALKELKAETGPFY